MVFVRCFVTAVRNEKHVLAPRSTFLEAEEALPHSNSWYWGTGCVEKDSVIWNRGHGPPKTDLSSDTSSTTVSQYRYSLSLRSMEGLR